VCDELVGGATGGWEGCLTQCSGCSDADDGGGECSGMIHGRLEVLLSHSSCRARTRNARNYL